MGNLEFYFAVKQLLASSQHGLMPERLICPLLSAAKARGVNGGMQYRLTTLAMAERTAAAQGISTRAASRQVAQTLNASAILSLAIGDKTAYVEQLLMA